MADTTDIFLPDTLPYPIRIVASTINPSEDIQQGQLLLKYSYTSVSSDDGDQETRYGTWESSFNGKVISWKIAVGNVITRLRAKQEPALLILEPCKHGVQFNGLCALCGMNLEDFDFSGRAESSLATIQMTHSAAGPTVSLEEAQKLEHENAQRLLKARKLSLIVDLDQTVVHATVDPTVGEWISEGEAWEKRNGQKEAEEDGSGDGDGSEADIKQEVNPNWFALKDVKKFRLAPEVFNVGQFTQGAHFRPGRTRTLETEGCVYFIKPRPGWQEFFTVVSKKFEMHVYTMGTRAYAEEVCSFLDPEGRFFGGRILSRDESGSLTQKSLRRLFPCDTSMVVIIDDRADVWEWSPNLIKVIPYDFFVGIGDINSAFLPKLDAQKNVALPIPNSSRASEDDSENGSEGGEQAIAKRQLISLNNEALVAQREERPLAKKQEELTGRSLKSGDEQQLNAVKGDMKEPDAPGSATPAQRAQQDQAKKPLLKNEDTELMRVGMLLDEVHSKFFAAYDASRGKKTANRESPKISPIVHLGHDVTAIIPKLRERTLKGVHILFSGVIPTNIVVEHEKTDIWRIARAFGAICHKDLTDEVTHVVTSKRGTQKADQALKRRHIYVVWLSWFNDSISKWERQDELPYLLVDATPPISSTLPANTSMKQSMSTLALTNESPEDDSGKMLQESKEEQVPIGKEIADVDFGDVDWQGVHDEVEAAMMESDSEEDDDLNDIGDDAIDNNISNQWNLGDDISRNTFRSHKRLRSVTPSIKFANSGSSSDQQSSAPLAKRKKVDAYDKFRSSSEGFDTAEYHPPDSDELRVDGFVEDQDLTEDTKTAEGDDDEYGDDDDEEFDFLAKELDIG